MSLLAYPPMIKYIFWSFPFLISFTTYSGRLNDNHYIKLFAFEFIFIIMFVFNVLKRKSVKHFNKTLYISDILVLGLLVTYSFFYIGEYNIIDNSVFLMYVLFYFFIRNCSDRKAIDILMNSAPIVIALHLLLCILQHFQFFPNFNSHFEIGSTFGNPDMLSAYLAVLLPFCYMNNKLKVFRVILIGLIISLFFFLQARTAIVTTVIVLLFYYIRKRKIPKMYIISGILMLVAGFILLICWHEISVLGRLYIWIVALSMIISKPFGWGPYAFEKHYPEYQSKFTVEHPEIANILNYDIVHSPFNEFLNIAVTVGIIGLILYLLFVAYILITAYKTKSLLFYPLLAFQIVSLSYFPFKIIPLTVIYIICCSIVISTSKLYKIDIATSLAKSKLFTFIIIVPVLFCFLFGLFSFSYWKKAIKQSSEAKTYSHACESFKRSQPFLRNNGRFLISFAELKYKMNDDSALFLMEQADNYFADVAFLHNLALLYEQAGRIEDAKIKYEIAVNMSPKNINISYAQICFLQRTGDIDKAYQLAILLRKKITNTPSKYNNQLVLKKINELIDCYEF